MGLEPGRGLTQSRCESPRSFILMFRVSCSSRLVRVASWGPSRQAADAMNDFDRDAEAFNNLGEKAFQTQARPEDMCDADRTLRKCSGCGSFHKWKKMKSEAVADGSDPRLTWWVFTCLECLCSSREKASGVKPDAKAVLREEIVRPWSEKRLKRVDNFQKAMTEVLTELEGEVFSSNKAKKEAVMLKVAIKLEELKSLFTPVVDLIQAKHQDMSEAVKKAEKFSVWRAASGNYQDLEADEDLNEGLKLEQEFMDQATFRRAFADRGEDRARLRMAADYSDVLMGQEFDASVEGSFRVYYFCNANVHGTKCNTLILSDKWKRFYSDISSTGQRWYCQECNARYKTTFGVVVEIILPKVEEATGEKFLVPHIFRADLPPDDIKDLKAMIVEKYHGSDAPTPEQLLERLPTVQPIKNGMFTEGITGHFQAKGFDWEAVPKLSWDVIYKCSK